jgi:hypothetical protein
VICCSYVCSIIEAATVDTKFLGTCFGCEGTRRVKEEVDRSKVVGGGVEV